MIITIEQDVRLISSRTGWRLEVYAGCLHDSVDIWVPLDMDYSSYLHAELLQTQLAELLLKLPAMERHLRDDIDQLEIWKRAHGRPSESRA